MTPTVCVFCRYTLAPGDRIACRGCRARLDATRMTWDHDDTEQPRLLGEGEDR